MNGDDTIRLFGLSHAALERELDKVEASQKIDLGRSQQADKDEAYYPQFDQALRSEAAAMGEHYELFYCLEKGIRKLVAETLEAQHGEAWRDTQVPPTIRQNAKTNIQREIDFTTFGELGEIVRNNWDSFGGIFSSEKAFTKIMTSLNMLRGPIAHCCPLAEDEVLRLKLTVKDWFRLME